MARLRWLIAVNAAVAAALILIHFRFDAPAPPASAPDLPDALRDRTSIHVSVEYDDEFLKDRREMLRYLARQNGTTIDEVLTRDETAETAPHPIWHTQDRSNELE